MALTGNKENVKKEAEKEREKECFSSGNTENYKTIIMIIIISGRRTLE